MKLEIVEFLLHLHGVETNYLNMKAPKGQRVFHWPRKQPMTRMERYHAKHFPNSKYDFGRYGSIASPYASRGYGAYYGMAAATGVYLTALPFMMGTAVYPQVSGNTYQTAMTGQPAGSDSRLVFNSGEGIFSYFSRGWQ